MKARALVAVLAIASAARADEAPAPEVPPKAGRQPEGPMTIVKHVVVRGDTCGSIAQKYYGDARWVALLHAANPELARKPVPHVLEPGTVLVIAPKPPPKTGPDAELTAVRNQVEVLTPETKPGKPNDPLFRGNRVSTEAESAADVTFRDETQVKLGERTLVVILGDAHAAAMRIDPSPPATTLVTGELRAFMAGARRDKDTPAIVGTDAAHVKVYTGEAKVSADARKTTRLAVYRGSSAIDASGRTREVARGFGSKADVGQAPTPPRPLPPAPAWSPAPPSVVVDPARIVGGYDAGAAKVASWHVQIARDGIFRDVAVDAKVPATIRSLEANAPGPGRYYVRVSAIDDDGFEGPFGVIARTLVVAPKLEPLPNGRRLSVEPRDAFCVRVGNVRLTRIDRPMLVGNEPIRLRCASNDAEPTTLISLP